jgi:serine O-acetyltransferase
MYDIVNTGFQALQAYRVAHWLWRQRRETLAMFLHSQVRAKGCHELRKGTNDEGQTPGHA